MVRAREAGRESRGLEAAVPGGLWPAAPGFLRGTGQRAGRGTARGQPGGAGSYLLQGEGGAVAALLPPQEPVVEVAGGVSSEWGRACGPRAALGTASGRQRAAPAPSPGPGPVPPAHRANRIGQVPKPTIAPLRVPMTKPAELPGRSPPDRGRSGQEDRGCLDAVLTPQHHRETALTPPRTGGRLPAAAGGAQHRVKDCPVTPEPPRFSPGPPGLPQAAQRLPGKGLFWSRLRGERRFGICASFRLGCPTPGGVTLHRPQPKPGSRKKKKKKLTKPQPTERTKARLQSSPPKTNEERRSGARRHGGDRRDPGPGWGGFAGPVLLGQRGAPAGAPGAAAPRLLAALRRAINLFWRTGKRYWGSQPWPGTAPRQG